MNRRKVRVQVRMLNVVLRGYMLFSEDITNLIIGFNKCKCFKENLFIKLKLIKRTGKPCDTFALIINDERSHTGKKSHQRF